MSSLHEITGKEGGILNLLTYPRLLAPLRAFAGHLLTSESVDFIIEVSNYENDMRQETKSFVYKYFPPDGIPDPLLASIVTKELTYAFNYYILMRSKWCLSLFESRSG